VKGHDYVACCDVYQIAVERARRDHIPSVVHVTEMTQPQGHSTSGSHERYKSKDRLRFEIEFDPLRRMREWMIHEEIADAATLDGLEREARIEVEHIREAAWDAYVAPIQADREHALAIIEEAGAESGADLEAIARVEGIDLPVLKTDRPMHAAALVSRALDGHVRILRPYCALHKVDVLHRGRGLPLEGDPKRSSFRIHRDTRFSNDKTPYKTQIGSIWYRQDSGKDGAGILYFHLAAEGCFAAAAFYRPAAEVLGAIRERIRVHPDRFLAMQASLAAGSMVLDPSDCLTRMPRGFEDLKDSAVASALRLISMLLIEQTEEWTTERRYLSEESMYELFKTTRMD